MNKFESLASLIHSLTKSEKKSFKQRSTSATGAVKDYLVLFEIIEKSAKQECAEVKSLFNQSCSESTFDITVSYLYKLLLDTLLSLRLTKDSDYILFNQIMKAKVLFEKSLFQSSLDMLSKTMKDAKYYENYFALLLAGRLELNYLMALNFPNISETDLVNKQMKMERNVRRVRQINEQSSLFELLKHRLIFKGDIRSPQQKQELNDLIVSEMSINSSSSFNSFEMAKMHQLFQANYLISVGDYKSALRAFMELSVAFENNKHLWASPPIYYMLTLEGVLDGLRSIKDYEGMRYFVDRLKALESSSISFKMNVTCLVWQYEIFPFLDTGRYEQAYEIMQGYKESLYEKMHLLSLNRQAELCLYSALVHIGMRDFLNAKKYLRQIVLGNRDYQLPLYRTIRLVNLMIRYELKDVEWVKYESQSIKRNIARKSGFKLENAMLKLIGKGALPPFREQREMLWSKMKDSLYLLKEDKYEQQVLKMFDFVAWMESITTRIPLSQIIQDGEGELMPI